MSKILWSKTLLPPASSPVQDYTCELYGTDFRVPRVQVIPSKETDMVDLPDRKAYRSMSRAAVMLSAVCMPAKDVLEPFMTSNRFRVGMYCAIENGPNDFSASKAMAHTPTEEFAEMYKKLRSPKIYLRQLPNLAPAHVGIFMNLMGPMNVYTHSRAASVQALDQAEFDLAHGIVDAALVCSAFSLEDPLLNLRTRQDTPANAVLSEGAAAIVLVKDGTTTNWLNQDLTTGDVGYGISQQLINLAKKVAI